MDKESVLKILSKILYPPYQKDIVTFGMVKEVRIDGENLTVGIYTGVKKDKDQLIQQLSIEALEMAFPSAKVRVEMLETDPAAAASVTPNEQTLKDVKIKIAIASGKGGVGKSTVAVNLARAFARIFSTPENAKVGLMDCDVHGPSATILFGEVPPLLSDGEKIFPPVTDGVKTISMGMLVDDSQPLIWRGPMITSAIKQFTSDVAWGELEILILDLPPGTGDAVISAAQIIPLNGALIVTTANKLAEKTATRGAKIFEKMNVKILGVVENMAYLPLPDGSKMKLFGEGDSEDCARELHTSVISQIPIDASLQTENPSQESREIFDAIAKSILDSLK